jgi:hypothetical protein
MKIGTKSVLFGVHQFLWHPLTVGYAWRRLFKVWPTWREWVCIFVHDLGYWGKPNIDGPEGRQHPVAGAWLASALVDRSGSLTYFDLPLYHSREFAKQNGEEPSLLCWADKYCVTVEPRWFYRLRAKLSGEVHEFRSQAPKPICDGSIEEWAAWYEKKVLNLKEIKALLES